MYLYRRLGALSVHYGSCISVLRNSLCRALSQVFLNGQKRDLSDRSDDNFGVMYVMPHLLISLRLWRKKGGLALCLITIKTKRLFAKGWGFTEAIVNVWRIGVRLVHFVTCLLSHGLKMGILKHIHRSLSCGKGVKWQTKQSIEQKNQLIRAINFAHNQLSPSKYFNTFTYSQKILDTNKIMSIAHASLIW